MAREVVKVVADGWPVLTEGTCPTFSNTLIFPSQTPAFILTHTYGLGPFHVLPVIRTLLHHVPEEEYTFPTATLTTATLTTATLTTAIFPTAILTTAILTTAIFPTATITTAIFPTAILTTAILTTAIFPTATITTAIFPTATLTTAILTTAIFPTATLQAATFHITTHPLPSLATPCTQQLPPLLNSFQNELNHFSSSHTFLLQSSL
ncbi:hypothetical protein Pmani_013111 [Petrolisthes manimaculis]|uniref:Uncharacterized protein n=1 Tax=Petrolisthes manimaculis TaxID=1843537 RepID=A0AAE1PZK6_9EUCA|nr:hypothetical protein Pmani_013111 [Petrolisthes manimaculis]